MNIRQKIGAGIVTGAIALSSMILPVQAANNGTDHFGPFASATTDGSSCGTTWANDQVNRNFSVHDNGNGTFNVTEMFTDGMFTTTGTNSPGACETSNHHGTTVAAGVTGNFQGFLTGTVTSASYNPNACTPATCNSTAGFVTSVFGPTAAFNITGFNFEYNSSDPTLSFHHWQDKSADGGTGEQFIGDIATQ